MKICGICSGLDPARVLRMVLMIFIRKEYMNTSDGDMFMVDIDVSQRITGGCNNGDMCHRGGNGVCSMAASS